MVAAPGEAARDAGPSQGRGAGVVAHVVPLRRAHAAALHVTPAHAQARQASHAGAVADAGVVEAGLCNRGGVSGEEKNKKRRSYKFTALKRILVRIFDLLKAPACNKVFLIY